MKIEDKLTEIISSKAREDAKTIIATIKRSVEDCVTGSDYERDKETLLQMTKQTHSYRGLSNRYYHYGRGAVVRDDKPEFDLMYRLGFVDKEKSTILAPKLDDCLPSRSLSLYGPSYWFLSQKAIDLYLEAEKEDEKS